MTDSIPLKQIKAEVKAYDDALLATDPRFRRMVQIIHEDGTVLMFQNAFVMKKDDWVICFTEHCGFHIFHHEDLYGYSMYEEMHSMPEDLP